MSSEGVTSAEHASAKVSVVICLTLRLETTPGKRLISLGLPACQQGVAQRDGDGRGRGTGMEMEMSGPEGMMYVDKRP